MGDVTEDEAPWPTSGLATWSAQDVIAWLFHKDGGKLNMLSSASSKLAAIIGNCDLYGKDLTNPEWWSECGDHNPSRRVP